jgi:hypothetical protein
MPYKLENSSCWYAEATLGKVKCLVCEASFARKVSRMLSHLGSKALMAFATTMFRSAE